MRINDHTDAKTNSTTTKHIGWGEEGGVVGMYATCRGPKSHGEI